MDESSGCWTLGVDEFSHEKFRNPGRRLARLIANRFAFVAYRQPSQNLKNAGLRCGAFVDVTIHSSVFMPLQRVAPPWNPPDTIAEASTLNVSD